MVITSKLSSACQFNAKITSLFESEYERQAKEPEISRVLFLEWLLACWSGCWLLVACQSIEVKVVLVEVGSWGSELSEPGRNNCFPICSVLATGQSVRPGQGRGRPTFRRPVPSFPDLACQVRAKASQTQEIHEIKTNTTGLLSDLLFNKEATFGKNGVDTFYVYINCAMNSTYKKVFIILG